jgi:hypothetical protein
MTTRSRAPLRLVGEPTEAQSRDQDACQERSETESKPTPLGFRRGVIERRSCLVLFRRTIDYRAPIRDSIGPGGKQSARQATGRGRQVRRLTASLVRVH